MSIEDFGYRYRWAQKWIRGICVIFQSPNQS